METCDLTIIGGGTSGLCAALFAAQYGLTVHIIEPACMLGGQPKLLYPDKIITNVPGLLSVTGSQLSDNLIAQAMTCNPTVRLSEELRLLAVVDESLYSLATDKAVHLTRAVIIAARSKPKQRRLQFVYDSQLDGNAVFYGAPDREKFRQKRVLVVGGGSSAVEWAGQLSGNCTSLELINRKDRLDAYPALRQRLIDLKVEVRCGCELMSIERNAGGLRCRLLWQGVTIDTEADCILACLGSDPDLDFEKGLGLETSARGISVRGNMESNLARVYAIGDAADYPYKQRLIACGFGEAAIAVGSVARQLGR